MVCSRSAPKRATMWARYNVMGVIREGQELLRREDRRVLNLRSRHDKTRELLEVAYNIPFSPMRF